MSVDRRIRILHLTPDLNSGGAEIMLFRLVLAMDRDSFAPVVVSMTDAGSLGPGLEDMGVPVHSLGMKRGRLSPLKMVALVRLLQERQPQVIQTWMYHADLMGAVAARFVGGIPVAWGIHHSTLVPGKSRPLTILTAKACAAVSGVLPARIICCSESSRRVHRGLGYPEHKMTVIPNGFDLESFAPDAQVRREVRAELKIAPEAPVVGLVARFDPQKDHRNFVLAAATLARNLPEAVFVLCGDGVDAGNEALVGWIDEQGLASSFRLLGVRSDVSKIVQALDVSGTSSSFGEAFPLVVGESMACGVPCVVTDVGDSAAMVGDTGVVVAPGCPGDLAAAWLSLFEMGREQRAALGARARKRILERYDLAGVVRRYESVYRVLIGR